MNTIGFLISTKENEKRRALVPNDVKSIRNREYLFFEVGYGKALGFGDVEYVKAGANIVSKEDVLKSDVICEPKIGDATYLSSIEEGKTLFGWIHAVNNESVTELIIKNKLSAIAWEDMNKHGRHIFWENSELAGKAAVLHALPLFGRLPSQCNVAVIGRGNVAMGAYNILSALGANITVYKKANQSYLRNELEKYDIVVNGILWDPYRVDHLIYEKDLNKMKHPSLIIDVSCDEKGAIESSHPTSIEDPVYMVDGVMHYVVDHTPAIFGYSATINLSSIIKRYIDDIVEGKVEQNKVLRKALIIDKGVIKDKKILDLYSGISETSDK